MILYLPIEDSMLLQLGNGFVIDTEPKIDQATVAETILLSRSWRKLSWVSALIHRAAVQIYQIEILARTPVV